MNLVNTVRFVLVLGGIIVLSSTAFAQPLIEEARFSNEEATLTTSSLVPDGYQLEMTGPNDYYWMENITSTREITVSNRYENGDVFANGSYHLLVTPVFDLTLEQQQELRALVDAGDKEGEAAFREEHQVPANLEVYTINFSVLNGQIVSPYETEEEVQQETHAAARWNYHNQNRAGLFAGVQHQVMNVKRPIATRRDRLQRDETPVAPFDQVFADDVIVQSSLCVGFDCNNGESFGSDTQRLKENNLRIHFDDTSASASFPGNDWRLQANDSTNGGQNYFAIADATAGRIPFRIEAGAPANALYVKSSGDIGIGNSSPVVEVHVTDGDSPTLRLEQNGSSGFGSQTWDIAGNETNFFIRDVNNGSQLPFKIRPGADDNSIVINNNNNIGLGVLNPTHRLQVESGNVYVKAGNVGINKAPSSAALDVAGDFNSSGSQVHTLGTNGATYFNSFFQTVLRLDATNARVGIGTSTPNHQLELSMDDAFKPNGGDWDGASDRRLKTDIDDFNDGLDVVMAMRPVRYRYNGLLNLPTDEEYIGVIAQEMQEIAPYTVGPLNDQSEAGQAEDYLSYNGTAVTYILVNAVQEQQATIDAQQEEITALQGQVAQLEELKAQMAALTQMVAELNEQSQTAAPAVTESDDK